jgi:transcriptional regulator of acetoin/glycerol metabolism
MGAYTGADHTRHGLVVEAEGGTLFLDEIGDIGPRGQVALLRSLDSGEVRPVGSHRISRVKPGVVTATNRLLKERILHDAIPAAGNDHHVRVDDLAGALLRRDRRRAERVHAAIAASFHSRW